MNLPLEEPSMRNCTQTKTVVESPEETFELQSYIILADSAAFKGYERPRHVSELFQNSPVIKQKRNIHLSKRAIYSFRSSSSLLRHTRNPQIRQLEVVRNSNEMPVPNKANLWRLLSWHHLLSVHQICQVSSLR